jgi:hypothetical protein
MVRRHRRRRPSILDRQRPEVSVAAAAAAQNETAAGRAVVEHTRAAAAQNDPREFRVGMAVAN